MILSEHVPLLRHGSLTHSVGPVVVIVVGTSVVDDVNSVEDDVISVDDDVMTVDDDVPASVVDGNDELVVVGSPVVVLAVVGQHS